MPQYYQMLARFSAKLAEEEWLKLPP